MSGLLRRLTRRRPATADETGSPVPVSSEPAGAPAETPAEAGGGQPVPDEQATQVIPVTADQPVVAAAAPQQPAAEPAPVRDLPAGVDPSELAVAPAASASRGKLRRRLRYLREVRELLLRDLGGFIFEIHRTAGGTVQDAQRHLIESKTNRIAGLDAEVRGLEGRLAEPHAGTVLHEPGIGGLCPECGELHASDAHYCARCGAPLNAKARARRDAAVAAAAQPATGSQPTVEPAPASVLWAAGPHPRAQAAPEDAEKEQTDPSLATSQWLALPKKPDDAPATTRPAPKPEEPAAEASAPEEPVPAPDEAPTTADEPAAAKPKRARTKKPATRSPPRSFEPTPNGKPAPAGDPLSTRPEQGS